MLDEEVEFDSEDGAEKIEMNREFVGFNEEENSNEKSSAEGDMTSGIIILQETEKRERQGRLIPQGCYVVELGK